MSTMILPPLKTTRVRMRASLAPTPSVRLTRRGRLAVFVLAMMLVLGAGVLIAAGSAATEEPAATEIVTVGSGDTLWGIASEVADDGDTRAMVQRIQGLNSLDSGMLVAGQELKVPAA